MTHLAAFQKGLGDRRAQRADQVLAGVLDELLVESLRERESAPPAESVLVDFITHLGAMVPEESEPLDWLEALHFADVLLAFLAARHDEESLRALSEKYIARASAIVCGRGESQKEVSAVVVEHLLVPAEGCEARILSYSGRGPLSAWVHMVCKRKAMELGRRAKKPPTEAEEFIKSSPALADPELDLLKFRYAEKFNKALERALKELPAADANLLYLTSVKRVPPSATARMEGVSERTIQRRIVRIRKTVFDETRRIAREQLGATDTEMSSLLGLVQSRLNVTLHRVLKPTEGDTTGV